MRLFCAGLAALQLILGAAGHLPTPVLVDHPIVELPAGRFRGDRLRVSDSTYLRLRGVQFAEHPVGKLRWQPPRPLPKQAGITDALAFGNDCVQGPLIDRLQSVRAAATGEDCLYLNVWAPEVSKALPVLFWIHGGSFTHGGSSTFSADGMMAIRRGVVLVSSNYRLGAMGFLAGDAVQRSTTDGSAGNFALQDNREALHWVKRNIVAVGGDASRVTIFGHSSGASHVTTHMVMPRSAGLFSSAIAQSGAWDNFTIQAIGSENANFRQFAHHAGCGDSLDDDVVLECLKQRPLRSVFGGDIMTAIANTSKDALFGPTVDSVELADVPENLAAQGQINKLDAVLLGTAHDEARFIMPVTQGVPGGPYTNQVEFHQWVRKYLPADTVDEALSLYRADDYGGNWWFTAGALYTDQQYNCPAARSARWLARYSGNLANHTYVYKIMYAPETYRASAKWWYYRDYCLPGFTPLSGHLNHFFFPCPEVNTDIGVGHGAELGFLFPDLTQIAANSSDMSMTEAMLGWWQSFAANHDPTVQSGSPSSTSLHWKPFSRSNQAFHLKPLYPAPVADNRARFCEFWDRQHPLPYKAAGVTKARAAKVIV